MGQIADNILAMILEVISSMGKLAWHLIKMVFSGSYRRQQLSRSGTSYQSEVAEKQRQFDVLQEFTSYDYSNDESDEAHEKEDPFSDIKESVVDQESEMNILLADPDEDPEKIALRLEKQRRIQAEIIHLMKADSSANDAQVEAYMLDAGWTPAEVKKIQKSEA